MDRLTIPNWDYNDMSLGTIGPCLARLSAYEDIGLEPEQLRDMMTDPVVRCGECKHGDWYTTADGRRLGYCMEMGVGGRTEDDFCSYGEREEGDA